MVILHGWVTPCDGWLNSVLITCYLLMETLPWPRNFKNLFCFFPDSGKYRGKTPAGCCRLNRVSNMMECINTVMRSLNMGICFEKFIIRWIRCCVNTIECTHTNLDAAAYYTPRLDGTAYCSWLQTLYSPHLTSSLCSWKPATLSKVMSNKTKFTAQRENCKLHTVALARNHFLFSSTL